MSTPVLVTKLYIPQPGVKLVPRSRLIKRLNEGLRGKLTLISAPAGFGKTSLVSTWVVGNGQPTAWLSVDEGDNDPTRFLIYLVAALQTIAAMVGEGVMTALQSPQPPSTETLLTILLNEIAAIPDNFILVLDDYHVITVDAIHHALTFLIDHLPPRMHLVIATREDPQVSLARLRAQHQLTELRANDLRFTADEAAQFLNQSMGLNLSAENIHALEARTEGWIAGLQLAAISMQGHQDTTDFITSFTGSHHFVLDYLIEEVLQQQPKNVQAFLLQTAFLNRLCGALCDAVLNTPAGSGQETLAYLERSNLFIIPLDNHRHWYRYHHLFAELLKQRLHQNPVLSANVEALHSRASQWFEAQGLDVEAFQHAAAANDIARAEYLMESKQMPLLFRGAMTPIMKWLESMPTTVLDSRPSLWVWYAFTSMSLGQASGIEEKLQAAEAALEGIKPDNKIRDIIGRIAAIRAMLAIPQNNIDTMISQAQQALAFLNPNNLPVRAATTWALGYAYHLLGDRPAASAAYTEVMAISEASGNIMFNIAATSGIGSLQESDNQLFLAAETYRRVLQLAGDPPLPHANGACFGLAQIYYEWNNLDAALTYGQQSLHLGRQIESIDLPASAGAFLARVKLTQGKVDEAIADLAEAERFARQHSFLFRLPELAAVEVLIRLHQGDLKTAADVAQMHQLPMSQTRVLLAQGNTVSALAILKPWLQQVAAKDERDVQLKGMVLLAVAHYLQGETDQAVELLAEILTLAAVGGFVRIFLDEGLPMMRLLSEAANRGIMPQYANKLLAEFTAEGRTRSQPLIEPLSERELEILQLVAQGLSNSQIGERLFIALDTVKGHNRRIYDKLHVQRRTEAVARARELGLLK